VLDALKEEKADHLGFDFRATCVVSEREREREREREEERSMFGL
jgi:hypothetical protein